MKMKVTAGTNWTYLGHGEFVRLVQFAGARVVLEVVNRAEMEREILARTEVGGGSSTEQAG